MAYIGQGIKQGTFKVLDTSGNTYNGTNTTFSLGTQVGSAAQLLVSHDGVIQLPGTDYTLATGGTQITFSTAPASGASIFITEISGAVGVTVTPSDASVTSAKLSGNLETPGTLDVNGQELILDADGDTTITADTDDQIDVKISGADDFQFTANTFTAQSGSSIVVPDGGLTLGSTAVSSTAAELNLLDGGTSVGSSITVADADGFIVNDGGTMKTITATDISTYVGGTFVKTGSVDFESGTGADNVFLSDVFSDTYDTYMIILRRILPEDDGDLFRMRFTSTGTTEISSGSYNYSSRYFKDDGGVSSRTATGATRFELTDEVSNVQADGGADFTLFITLDRTDNAGNSGSFHGTGHYNNASTSSHATYVSGVVNRGTDQDKPGGLQFLFASGQIRKIHAIVYGIK